MASLQSLKKAVQDSEELYEQTIEEYKKALKENMTEKAREIIGIIEEDDLIASQVCNLNDSDYMREYVGESFRYEVYNMVVDVLEEEYAIKLDELDEVTKDIIEDYLEENIINSGYGEG